MRQFRKVIIVLSLGTLALFLVKGSLFAMLPAPEVHTRIKNCADCHSGVELTGKDIDLTGYNEGSSNVLTIFWFNILDPEGNEVAREESEEFLFEAHSEATKHIPVNNYSLADGEWKYVGWVQPYVMEYHMDDNEASVLLYKGLISDNDKPDTPDISKSYSGDWFVSDEFGHFGGPEKTSLFSTNGTVEHKFLMTSGWFSAYIWYLESPDNGTEIPVTIMRNKVKLDKVSVNQQKNGSKMYFLGEYPFDEGDTAKVIIAADGKGNFVSSDAVFLERSGNLDNGDIDDGDHGNHGCFITVLR